MSYTYQVVDQTPGGRLYLNPGETKTAFFKMKNTGTSTWSKTGSTPVRLGTDSPQNRASGFYKSGNAGWLSSSRIEMQEATVAPNQTATFEFEVTGLPSSCAIHPEYFTPVVEGVQWMSGPGPHLRFDMRAIGTTLFLWYTKDGHHWDHPIIAGNRSTDIPKLGGGIPDGPYSSADPDVAYRHVELISNAGLNLIALDYAGYDDITHTGAAAIIKTIEDNSEFSHIRFCFFMDNMKTWSQGQFDVLAGYNSHPNIRKYDTKPLLLTFGNPPGGASDSQNRFTYVSCGAQDATTGWHFESWPPMNPVKGACGTVIARFDDRVTVATPPTVHGKPSTQIQTHDPNLTEDMFASQFDTVYNVWNDYDNNMRIVFFNAFNEYPERISVFEPHEDRNVNGATSPAVSDTYLYDRLTNYVTQLKDN